MTTLLVAIVAGLGVHTAAFGFPKATAALTCTAFTATTLLIGPRRLKVDRDSPALPTLSCTCGGEPELHGCFEHTFSGKCMLLF